jgi:hypothetical protein
MSDPTKEQLVYNIKEWVKIENEIKQLQKAIKDRREKKKQLTNTLVGVMKTHDIDCFDINNGQIMYTKNKIKAPITKKSLQEILIKFYGDDNKSADDMKKFILDNRQEIIKENIRHKLEKKKEN